MFGRWSRVISVAMAGVVCFGVILPLALRRHDDLLGVGVVSLFAVYLIFNTVLWLRMKPHTPHESQ